ncbi:uncharacterized protein BDV14DRAFT_201605 [Aspergillus stella-maris]|uniref:uncharacterized protein n=1 Tax=Aspergillus stella-maris TaxID=1810926 RepID=UPI003CCD0A90
MEHQTQPPISISPVSLADIDAITRNVTYPAFEDDPLQRVIFQRTKAGELDEEEVSWNRESLADALRQESEILFKAYASDGAGEAEIVGVIGWTLQTGFGSEMLGLRNRQGRSHTEPDPCTDPNTNALASLNVAAWISASRTLREERERVLSDYRHYHPGKGIFRITFMAVAPAYQHGGLRSALMKTFCEQIEGAGLNEFVMSSPAGVRLYSKFGFQAIRSVDIGSGTYTSMLRVS